jgi:hypothetical protein
VKNRRTQGRIKLAARIAATGLLISALPTASLALGLISSDNALIAFTPASADPRLAELVSNRSGEARMLRFTPAGVGGRTDRAVTVAVRVDPKVAQAITVRAAIQAAKDQVAGEVPVGITAARYNLGIARGYQGFTRPAAPTLSTTLSEAAIPDLAAFRPAPARAGEPSRFATRIALEEQAKAGAAPRTLDSRSDQQLDVGGSYRLTRNLNVTAGVRYSQERDRLAPLADPATQDSQAVYVGTQFRF